MTESGERPAAPPGLRAHASTLLRGLSLVALVVFLAVAAQRTCAPPEWAFSVEATTQVVEVELREPAETRWRVDGASLCTRAAVDIDPAFVESEPACSGRAWKGHRLAVPEPVIVLEGGVRAVFEWLDERTLATSLQDLDGGSMARLSIAGAPEVPLAAPVNLIWSLDGSGSAPLPPELVFPFTGSTTIGRDIHWSGTGVLTGGRVTVFTASESAERRRAVDGASLMLGDQVSLRADGDAGGPAPKGFIRARLTGGEGGGVFDVVAFGRAERMRVDRFGDSGYDLSPSLLTRVLNDPVLVLGGTFLVAFLGLVQNVQPLLDPERAGRLGWWAWLRDRLRRRRRRGREEES